MSRKNGFTLIELLVVIAIIALLLSIVVPAMRMAKEHAKRMICGTNLKSIGTAVVTYAQLNNDLLPPTRYSLGIDTDPSPYRAYYAYLLNISRPYGQHITGGPWGLATLYEAKLIETPEVFYCPSTPKVIEDLAGGEPVHYHYDGFHDESHPWPWNTFPVSSAGNNCRVSYMYLPQSIKQRDKWGFPAIATKSSQMHSGLSLTTDLLTRTEYLPHTRGVIGGKLAGSGRGINALFSDGSVRFCNDAELFDPSLWNPSPHGNNNNFRTILRLLH
jgi:prepilin-type N-terminal cleavage/methylation domain-containing protein